jgi:translocation and assembly module TamB
MADWKKGVGWTAIVIGAIVLVAIAATLVLLRNQGLHGWVLAKIVQQASEATGAGVELDNFDVHLKTLTADIYGLTIHGTEAAGEKPLLQIRKATVGLKIISILHRQVNLSELLVEDPVVNLTVNKDGHSNLPTPPPSNSKSSTNVFDLAVGHVLLTNGVIYMRDQKLPVYANLFGLRTEISFSQLEKRYSGTVEYTNGTIDYGALRPLPHALEAKFDASPSEFNLKPLVLRLGGSHVLLDATVRNYGSTPVANGRYDVLLHTQDFAGLASASTSGDIRLAGTMDYRDVANQPMLKNAKLDGDINSNGLAILTDQAVMKIQKLSGRYELADGNFKATGFAVNLLNGTLKADGTVRHLDTTPQSEFHVALAGVSLQALKSSLRSYSNQSVPMTGTINAQADAGWIGSISNLRASSTVVMHGAVVAANQSKSQSFPLNANVRINYDGPRSVISIPTGNIQLPATTITAQGEVGNHSNLAIKAVSTNLHQLLLLANGLQSSSANSNSNSSSLANVQGALTLNAVVQGTLQNPRITAQLNATKLQVNQGQFSSLQLALAANPSEVSIQNGSLSALPRGQLQFSAHAGLRRWAYVPSGPITASLHVRQMPLAMLDQIATKSYPITGDLNGDVQLEGSELNPVGQGRLEISKARVQDEPLQNVVLQFNASGGTIRSQVREGSNKATLNFTPKTKAYEVKLEVPPLEVSKLHAVQAKNLGVKGKLSITADGAGTLDNPKLNASVRMEQLEVRGTNASQVKLDLNVADHNAKFALNSTGGPANLRGNGTVRLSPGYYTQASLDTSRFPLDPLLAMYMPSRPNGLSAETELHATIRGPLADKTKVEAHLTIPTFETKYQALQLATTGPIRVDYANSVVTLQPSGFKGTDTAFQFQGGIPLAGSEKMSLTVKGSIDLRLAQMLAPDLLASGKISLDVSAAGTVKNPGVHGQIKIQNAAFATEAAPIGIDRLNATMQVSDTSVQITDAAGDLGGGQVRFGGSVIYRPELQANLSLSGKSVRLRYPDGMRSVFDTDLTLTGNAQGSTLGGRVLIDSISFTSDFDISTFMGQFTGVSSPPTGQSFADNVKLQIAVQSSSQLNAGTAQLGIEGQANLRIIGTASDPVVVGRTDIASGDIFFERRQYHFEQGVINFVNPNKTEPVLNLLITTTINQYNLNIRLTGPIEKLQTSYISDPPLPPIDIINLIARGQTTEGAPASLGASSVLAQGLSQVESTVGNNISKLTGVAGLQIDPLIGGNSTNPSARLGLQKRVTKNFTFTFSTDVTQPQNEIIQGEYQLNKRWSVSVVRDESGGFAVDGRFHTNF